MKDGRLGACIDVGMMLSRILEQEGFWNYIVKGSLTITFPRGRKLPRQYYWSWDVVEKPFGAAHAWVVAPPFSIIDISIKQQRHKKTVGHQLLPDMVVTEDVTTSAPDPADLFSPSFLNINRILPANAIMIVDPRLTQFFQKFSPVTTIINEVELKYTRVAVTAPDLPFPQMTGWAMNGRIGIEVYTQLIHPHMEAYRQNREGHEPCSP